MSIKDNLKKKQTLKLIQARIEVVLYNKLRAKLKKEGVKINDFISASAKAFLDET